MSRRRTQKRSTDKPSLASRIGSAIDSAIGVPAPGWGLKRMRDRGMMALTGAWHGSGFDRAAMRNWRASAGSANADLMFDRDKLRIHSRDLARNNPAACAAVGLTVTNVVGTGLTMRPRIDAKALGLNDDEAEQFECDIAREWELWAESTECDAARTNDFYGLQALAFRSMLESGDVFALLPTITRKRIPYTLAVQIIEADRVSNKDRAVDTKTICGGVEFDEYGAPHQYWISNQHPGDLVYSSTLTWKPYRAFGEKTGRRNVLHLFEQLRPGQARGVPFLAPVIEPLKQLGTYTDAELQAAVISGAFSIFLKMDPDAFDQLFNEDAQRQYLDSASQWDGDIATGKAVNLLPGEEPVDSNPGRPNPQFDPFVEAIFRQIGMALEIPFEVLLMHYQSSYSAARAALLTAWRVFYKRRDFLASRFCQPIYEEFLAEAVGMRRLNLPGFFADPIRHKAWCRAEWAGDGPGSIDPQKDVDAAEKRIDIGISTIDAESIRFDGIPFEDKHRQRVKENNMRREAGLLPGSSAPAMPGAAGANAGAQDNQDNQDTQDGLPTEQDIEDLVDEQDPQDQQENDPQDQNNNGGAVA